MAIKTYPGTYKWVDAVTKCSQDGKDVKGELPTPRSTIESEWYVHWAKGQRPAVGIFWLGVNDRDVVGEYTNQHGSPITYFNWAPNQPNQNGDEKCVVTGGAVMHAKKWRDTWCTSEKELLCVVGKSVILINS